MAYIAACSRYENGQRPSTVQYMEIDEYTDQLFVDDNEIILVAKHKTGLDKGPAKLVISDTEIKRLAPMLRQHQKAHASCQC